MQTLPWNGFVLKFIIMDKGDISTVEHSRLPIRVRYSEKFQRICYSKVDYKPSSGKQHVFFICPVTFFQKKKVWKRFKYVQVVRFLKNHWNWEWCFNFWINQIEDCLLNRTFFLVKMTYLNNFQIFFFHIDNIDSVNDSKKLLLTNQHALQFWLRKFFFKLKLKIMSYLKEDCHLKFV